MKKFILHAVIFACLAVPVSGAEGMSFTFGGSAARFAPGLLGGLLTPADEGLFSSLKKTRAVLGMSEEQKALYRAALSAQRAKFHVGGLEEGAGVIALQAEPLSTDDRTVVYDVLRMKPSTYILSSALMGFGTGLMGQSAWGSGLLFAAVDIANMVYLGLALVSSLAESSHGLMFMYFIPIVGEAYFMLDLLTGFSLTRAGMSQQDSDLFWASFTPHLLTSLAIFAVSHTLQALRSYFRARKYNSTLAQVLLLDTESSGVSLAPVVDPFSGQYGLVASIRLPSAAK